MKALAVWSFHSLLLFTVVWAPRGRSAQSVGCTQKTEQYRLIKPSEKKVTIASIEFQGDNPLNDLLRIQLVSEIQSHNPYLAADDSDVSWTEEAVEPIRMELQQQGYFRNFVEAKPFLIRAGTDERTYALRVVIESGPQYHFRSLTSKNESDKPLAFSQEILRNLFALHKGDLFDTSKIRAGLEALQSLYSTRGYIDVVVSPETSLSDDTSQIDVLLRIDEGEPYHLTKVEVLGLSSSATAQLKMPQKIGEAFNSILWNVSFFEDNKSLLPEGASPRDFGGTRNSANHTYELSVDFRPM